MFGPDTKKVRGKTVTFKKKERKKKGLSTKRKESMFCKVHARFVAKN